MGGLLIGKEIQDAEDYNIAMALPITLVRYPVEHPQFLLTTPSAESSGWDLQTGTSYHCMTFIRSLNLFKFLHL